MTRIGIATGYDPALDVRAFARTVREVDERGYEIAFFSETIALMRDSVTAMAAFALASQHVALGCTQVVRLRSPVTMAQTLASLDELSGGRMVLCPGAATALHAQRFGFPHVDPPTALTEWVEAIRLVLTGERVSLNPMRIEDICEPVHEQFHPRVAERSVLGQLSTVSARERRAAFGAGAIAPAVVMVACTGRSGQNRRSWRCRRGPRTSP